MKQTLALPPRINPNWKIGIVASLYHDAMIQPMIEAAHATLLDAGIKEKNIVIRRAAGSFEIPLIGSALAASGTYDGLIALGIIIEGQTHHAELLATQTARGIMEVQLDFLIPFAFEVLYVQNLAQARVRSTGKNNKGTEAALAILHTLSSLKKIQ